MRYWTSIITVLIIGGVGYFLYSGQEIGDSYGGKSPQEVLDLFIDALDKGDINLAVKYLMPNESLSQEEWLKALQKLKEKELLDDMAVDLKRAVPDTDESANESESRFIIKDNSGNIVSEINFQLDTRANIWKIKEL